MDVGYKASDTGSKHHTGVFLFHFYITLTVKLDLSCSSCNFTERNNLTSLDVI